MLPHLQFEMNFSASADEKTRFAAAVVRHFSEIMDTGTDHIAVTLPAFRADGVFGNGRATGFERVTVSDRGVRWGLVYDRAARER